MSEHMTFRKIAHGAPEYLATAELRNRVLRKPIGLKFSAADVEAEKRYHHLACYRGDALVACLMLDPLGNGDVRMRQLAVAPELQRQGIGKALVKHAEAWAQNAGYRHMTLHARETAVAFYKGLGYSVIGERFEEVTIPHWTMEKSLTATVSSPPDRHEKPRNQV
jgi:ribosomal protein S18 acetylase RimI-like enzyme